MARYRMELQAVLTVYVEAASEEEALEKVVGEFGTQRSPEGLELWEDYLPMGEPGSGIELSPAVTFYGRCEGNVPELLDDDDGAA